MTSPNEDPFFPKWLIYTLIATSMIAIIGLTIYSYQFWGLWPKSVGDYAAFGDYVGGLLGSILSAATIFLLIWSLIMQREELKETRKVLNETKDENARASSAHEMHLKHLQQQIEREDLYRALLHIRELLDNLLTIPLCEFGHELNEHDIKETSLLTLVTNPASNRFIVSQFVHFEVTQAKNFDLSWHLTSVQTNAQQCLELISHYEQAGGTNAVRVYHANIPIKVLSALTYLRVKLNPSVLKVVAHFGYPLENSPGAISVDPSCWENF